MKVVAFNGSARKDGNTAILIRHMLKELEREGIETEMVQFAGQTIRGCIACYRCFEQKDGHCGLPGDIINDCIDKMVEADGIVIGSPTYFADVSAETKAFIDRSGMVARANYEFLRRKVGTAVVAARRGGAIHAFDTINHLFTISQMIVVGSNYWNVGIGRDSGAVEGDAEGLETMETLGKNMAWLLHKLHG
jgi:multimeric flavodoxin WrbA